MNVKTRKKYQLIDEINFQVGPATVGLLGGNENFFLLSSAQALCMILLHTFWSVIFFNALDIQNYKDVAYVVLSHLLVSCLTLLNVNGLQAITLPSSYLITLISAIFALKVAGGSIQTVKRFVTCQ